MEIYRRRLPDWRCAGSVDFVTWRLAAGQRRLSPEELSLTRTCLQFFHGERYKLLAHVVMDDHVHVIVNPLTGTLLKKIIHTWKSYTANQMQRSHGRIGSVWQDESYDRIIRDEPELFEKMNYILTNPQRRWPGTYDYEWCGWCLD